METSVNGETSDDEILDVDGAPDNGISTGEVEERWEVDGISSVARRCKVLADWVHAHASPPVVTNMFIIQKHKRWLGSIAIIFPISTFTYWLQQDLIQVNSL